jgi:hypothetical protein
MMRTKLPNSGVYDPPSFAGSVLTVFVPGRLSPRQPKTGACAARGGSQNSLYDGCFRFHRAP